MINLSALAYRLDPSDRTRVTYSTDGDYTLEVRDRSGDVALTIEFPSELLAQVEGQIQAARVSRLTAVSA